MILKTIHCNVRNCNNEYTEKKNNEGFPGWGHIVGLQDEETNETTAHLCPEHLQMIGRVLNNGLD